MLIKLSADGIKHISFIGGEPFIKDYILEAGLFAKKLAVKTSAVTNGTVFCGSLAEDCVRFEAFDELIFSIDGYRKNHDILRGEGVYDIVERNIKNLCEIKRRYNRKKPSIMIYMTLSRYNFKDFDKDVMKLMKLNPSLLRIQLASSLSKDVINKTNQMLGGVFVNHHSYSVDVSLHCDEIPLIRDKVRRLKMIHGGRIKAEKILEGSNPLCQFLFKSAVITPSGRILPCPMLVNFDIGNIKKTSLKDAFIENEKRIRKIEHFSFTAPDICRQCCVEKIMS